MDWESNAATDILFERPNSPKKKGVTIRLRPPRFAYPQQASILVEHEAVFLLSEKGRRLAPFGYFFGKGGILLLSYKENRKAGLRGMLAKYNIPNWVISATEDHAGCPHVIHREIRLSGAASLNKLHELPLTEQCHWLLAGILSDSTNQMGETLDYIQTLLRSEILFQCPRLLEIAKGYLKRFETKHILEELMGQKRANETEYKKQWDLTLQLIREITDKREYEVETQTLLSLL